MSVKKYWKWIAAVAIAALLLLQLANPARTNPPVEPGQDLLATNPPPAQISTLLHGACYDCHSSETKWPWYSRVAPVSLWLIPHVEEGRDHLNFSEWPHDDPQRAAKRWKRIAGAVRDGSMPWPSYTWIHSPARLTQAQRKELVDWAEQESLKLKEMTNSD